MAFVYPTILALALAAAFLAGLVALWALASRRHWFWRALPIAVWLTLVRFTGAHELLLWFAAEFLTVATLVVTQRLFIRRAARRSAARANETPAPPGTWQFSLGDVLLCVLLAAVCMPALPGFHGRAAEPAWPDFSTAMVWVLAGAVCGTVCCLAAWTVFGTADSMFAPRRWLRFLIALSSALALGALLGLDYDNFGIDATPLRLLTDAPKNLPVLLMVTVIALCLASTVWLWLWQIGGWQPQPTSAPAQPESTVSSTPRSIAQVSARGLLTASLLSATTIVFGLWWYLARVVPLPPDVVGADQAARLVALGSQIDWTALAGHSIDEATPVEAQQFLALNADRLSEVHKIVTGPCGVRLDYSDFDFDLGGGDLRKLAYSFEMQSHAAAAAGDYGAAANAGLDCFRVGSRGQRGGDVTSRFDQFGIEQLALPLLAGAAPGLDHQQWRALDAELAAEERNREPLDDVYAREYAWTMNACGWFPRVEYLVGRLLGTEDAEPHRNRLEEFEAETLAELRLLRTALAIHFYRQDQGNFPPSLAALVPNWLDAAPLDPFSGQPLVYRVDDEGYLLYSVGPNRIDDGGRSVNAHEFRHDGDLLLDFFRLNEVLYAETDAILAAEAAQRARVQADIDPDP